MTASENHDRKKLASTAELLKTTWRIYKENYRLILGYVAWLLVPYVVHLLVSITFSQSVVDISRIFTSTLEITLFLWLTVLFISLTPYLRDKKQRLAKKVTTQISKLAIPYFLTSIITGTIFVIGIFLFIIPGIIFFVWFLFADIIVVLEKSSIKNSLKKSKEFVNGRAMAVLGKYLGGQIVIGILYSLIILAAYLIIGPLQGVSFEMILEAPPTVIGQTIEYLITIIFLPSILIFETLLYLSVKESR